MGFALAPDLGGAALSIPATVILVLLRGWINLTTFVRTRSTTTQMPTKHVFLHKARPPTDAPDTGRDTKVQQIQQKDLE
ncbi:hypothetical protein JDV02_004786 [Purpureocillium takamizusanense]|uniref:Uncharacterized protein n=1 Tax=Purpureocillium takamizusanense TaxID=2060973 RepID=A0A9Q8QFX8_9HYPO|nr:uncharacterized protein JDV02_004786 [Purpureocillium takamizusanense]UNI18522.1 hypothetical protein JDV02_004786 [Purpureocillium takamizusanense]